MCLSTGWRPRWPGQGRVERGDQHLSQAQHLVNIFWNRIDPESYNLIMERMQYAREIRQYLIAMPYWARSAAATQFSKVADQALATIEDVLPFDPEERINRSRRN